MAGRRREAEPHLRLLNRSSDLERMGRIQRVLRIDGRR